MAEAIVSLVVERIADLLIQEASYLGGVRKEVIRLQDELKRMRCFLKDAHSKQDQDERVRNWVAEIRRVAFDAEDVIDNFILKTSNCRKGKGVIGLIKSLTSTIAKGFHYHEIRNQIESILTRIACISASTQTYNIKFVEAKESSSSNSAMQRRLRRSYTHKIEEYIISFDSIKEELESNLMKEEESFCVVSVVGMGGCGKTVLAKEVYGEVKQYFDCYAWAFISQQYSVKDVLVRIMMSVASNDDRAKLQREEDGEEFEKMKKEQSLKSLLKGMDEEDLIKNLYKVLEKKRYLVVLDDIWSNEAWDCFKPAFPNGKKGSKILLTTRNREVASYADPWSSPVEPPLLTSDESWKLLSWKAFQRENVMEHGYATEFEKLGREMVKKCDGLPLAVVVLGSLLATKKSLNEWEVVQRNIDAQFTKLEQNNQYGGVYGILAMSYQALPFQLKPCFLHLSQYPEDWEFDKKSVIRMWIAEGFVPRPLQTAKRGETLEDVAEQYLEELITRSMLHVSERDYTGIGVKIFRMHDLMRDVCISRAREESFAQQDTSGANNSSSFPKTVTGMPRRLAIHPSTDGYTDGKWFYAPLASCNNKHLHSLTFFCKYKPWMTRNQELYIYKNLRLLRVLNIRGVRLDNDHIHIAVGNLIHLKFLGLRGIGLKGQKNSNPRFPTSLPVSIGKLKNLYTLDLRDNYYVSLPDVFWELENLRHLLLENKVYGSIRWNNLKNLQTLKWIRAKSLVNKDTMLNFPDLKNLGITFSKEKEAETILESPIFGENNHLRHLKLSMGLRHDIHFSSLESLSRCHHLTKLEVKGRISEDPLNLEFLPKSLIKLVLFRSFLKQDPMGILEKLPKLRFLFLEMDAFIGYKMVCSVNGFPQLEILRLKYLPLEEWEIEEGAMPNLKTLHVDCPYMLKMLPEGLKFVTTLQELKLTELSEELKWRSKVGKVDFHKIQHIPSISIT